ncbi:MAG: hypothetical protein FWE65_01530 [Eggerthellaceae bacterium]|nr:hypothetical protein [Eggerthellaceae bacterium]
MAFLPMTEREQAPEIAAEYDYWEHEAGRITNMKRTMLHHLPVYRIYMEWYRLYDELAALVGARTARLFSYAISTNNRCLVCSSFFRQILLDGHEDPDELEAAGTLSEDEKLLMEFGQSIAKGPNTIDEGLYARLGQRFDTAALVLLIGFAGQMIATNCFNMVAKVDLDDVLLPYATPEFLAQVFEH